MTATRTVEEMGDKPHHEPAGVWYLSGQTGLFELDPTPDMHTAPEPSTRKGWQPGDITG